MEWYQMDVRQSLDAFIAQVAFIYAPLLQRSSTTISAATLRKT